MSSMTIMSVDDAWLAGADGCPGGWLVVFVRPEGGGAHMRVVSTVHDLIMAPEGPAIVAIDIPIGLPQRAGAGGRAAENAVRPLLGARQSSVFSVPSRAAIEATDYRAACAAALLSSDPPRKVSKQLFMIVPKVRQVDVWLRANPDDSARLFEVHPELAFWRLNGERALDEPKKVKGRPHAPGLALRRRILAGNGFSADDLRTAPPCGAAEDDVLDAFACAAIARRIRAGAARPFPDPPERDAYGLPMAIWA